MIPVIVAGMHRSGTSAVTRLLQRLGVGVGGRLMGPSEWNVHGHFEELAFVAFHVGLLQKHAPHRIAGCDWLPLELPAPAYDDADYQDATLLWLGHRLHGARAWKDPRTSLFLDLWLGILPTSRVVVCLRHPYEVHRSLLRRGEGFLLADYAAGLRGWALYNERIAAALAGLPAEQALRVEMDDFADAPALAERLARFVEADGAASTDAAGAIDRAEVHCVLDAAGRREFARWFPDLEDLARRVRGGSGPVQVDDPDGVLAFPLKQRLDEFEKRAGLQEETLGERARYVEGMWERDGKGIRPSSSPAL